MVTQSYSLLFLFPLLLSLLSEGEYASDYLNPEMYWRNQGVACGVEALSGFLQDEFVDPQNVDALIGQLGADRFAEREAASEALKKAGALAGEQLREAAGSPDPEVAHRAKNLLRQIKEEDPGSTWRNQWMAIHSLGQLEDPAAKELLRAIAAKSEGRLASLAAQVLERASETPSGIDVRERSLPAGLPETTVGIMQIQPGQGLPAIGDFIRSSAMVQRHLVELVTGIGDLRLHRITAVADEILFLNPSSGHLLLWVEMDYDVETFTSYLTENRFERSEDRGFDVYNAGGVSLVPLDSGTLLVALHSSGSETEWGEIAGRLRQSDGSPDFSPALVRRMNDADRSAPFWGAALLPGEWVAKVEELAGVRSVAGGVKLDENKIGFSLKLLTLDEETAAQVAAYAESQVAKSLDLLKREGADIDVQPMVDALKTVKAEAKGDAVQLSAGISAETVLFMLNLFGMRFQ